MRTSVTRIALASMLLVLAACGEEPRTNRSDDGPDADGHVAATETTAQANAAVRDELALDDMAEFEAARRGFIATDDPLVTKNAAGEVVWNRPAFDFIEGEAPPSVNPSLWRQAKLNNIHGLFQVADRIYQVRGYDLSNMSIIEGITGRILVDPLTAVETARKAMALVNRELGERPLLAVILTHSHVDHFGGIKGVASLEDMESGKIRVIAPKSFMVEAVSENVMAGTVMGRRSAYMYGTDLRRSARGHIDSGLGKNPAISTVSMLAPTDVIDHTGQEMQIDGVDLVFQYTPHSEAPAELTFYLPQWKAFCGAEIVSKNMHNLYTLRGAKVRDALLWSGYIDQAIDLFGTRMEVIFNSHHWPVWGNEQGVDYLKKQRDTYKYIHDQTLRMAAAGATPREIAEAIVLPKTLRDSFASRGYYGTAKHNSKAVYQFYFGWYDGNPANLDPLPPEEEARRYVAAMGGAAAVIEKAETAFSAGDYRWAATMLDHVVFAGAGNREAKRLLARTYDQLGYRAESGPWRDVYLTGAQELRHGIHARSITGAVADVVNNIPLDMFFAAMETRLNGPEADGRDMTINFVFKDLGRTYVLTLENAVLHHKEQQADPEADATVTLTRAFWIKLVTKQTSIRDLIFSDDLDVDGDRLKLVSFFSLLEDPNEAFPIVTP